MSPTSGGDVDALQRELIKANGKKRPGPKKRDLPPKRVLAKMVRDLKG